MANSVVCRTAVAVREIILDIPIKGSAQSFCIILVFWRHVYVDIHSSGVVVVK